MKITEPILDKNFSLETCREELTQKLRDTKRLNDINMEIVISTTKTTRSVELILIENINGIPNRTPVSQMGTAIQDICKPYLQKILVNTRQ